MHVDDLADPEELWWLFAVHAALSAARAEETWSFDPGNQLLRYDGPADARIRMQRLYNGRTVLIGNPAAVVPEPSNWTGIPGWATSDAVRTWLQRYGANLLAWHHRDEWDTATPDADPAPVLAPLIDDTHDGLVDEAALRQLAADARGGRVTATELTSLLGDAAQGERGAAVLESAASEARPAQGQVRALLTNEVHAQMRATAEIDRLLPQRPAALVQWSRVALPPAGFEFAVRNERGTLIADLPSHRIPDQFKSSLLNVLHQLLAEEATDDAGAWLFARVTYDGVRLDFDRAFDSWPEWYHDPHGPSLGLLRWEMDQRSASFRPAWASLLPTDS